MRTRAVLSVLILLCVAVAPGEAGAQVRVTPVAGVHTSAPAFSGLRQAVESSWRGNDAGFVLGANVELGGLRGSLVYVTGARFTGRGIEGGDRLGEGSVLAVAGDLVMRPLPRLLGLQPYVLGGVGLKRREYRLSEDGASDPFPRNERGMALHLGAGADLMLGRLGVMLEVSDFIGAAGPDGVGRHDAFTTLGLKLALF